MRCVVAQLRRTAWMQSGPGVGALDTTVCPLRNLACFAIHRELYNGRRAGVRTDQGPRYCSIFPAFPPTCPEAYRAVTLHCLQVRVVLCCLDRVPTLRLSCPAR